MEDEVEVKLPSEAVKVELTRGVSAMRLSSRIKGLNLVGLASLGASEEDEVVSSFWLMVEDVEVLSPLGGDVYLKFIYIFK